MFEPGNVSEKIVLLIITYYSQYNDVVTSVTSVKLHFVDQTLRKSYLTSGINPVS